MNPGKLDRRITLSSLTESISGSGERVPTWSTLASNVPAQKREITGRETNVNGQEYAVGNVLFLIRYRSGVLPSGRVTYKSEEYNILSTREIGRGRLLEINTVVKKAA